MKQTGSSRKWEISTKSMSVAKWSACLRTYVLEIVLTWFSCVASSSSSTLLTNVRRGQNVSSETSYSSLPYGGSHRHSTTHYLNVREGGYVCVSDSRVALLWGGVISQPTSHRHRVVEPARPIFRLLSVTSLAVPYSGGPGWGMGIGEKNTAQPERR